MTDLPPVAPGRVIAGKFQVERLLGSGGMGVVVAARHLQLGQLVALKFLLHDAHKSAEAARRFMREGQALARLKSPHVARIMDVGALPEGEPYLVMEYLQGSDLRAVLQERTKLPVTEAVDYTLQVCEAIAEAHGHGIVHRDLKPSNLFLTRAADGTPLVKVLDFGISKANTQSGADTMSAQTSSGALVGSPAYMSPEQIRDARRVDGRTDIWALGVILHELLYGQPPFRGETVSGTLAAVAADAPKPIRELCPDVPAALESVILTCLKKDPAERYETVAALAHALAELAPADASFTVARITRLVGSAARMPAVDARAPALADDLTGSATLPAWEGHAVPTRLLAPVLAPRRRRVLAFVLPLAAFVAYMILRPSAPTAPFLAPSATQPSALPIVSAVAPASSAAPSPLPVVPIASAASTSRLEASARQPASSHGARIPPSSKPGSGAKPKLRTEPADEDGTTDRK